MVGARQKESFITAREYEGRGGHYEPKGMTGARQQDSITTARGGEGWSLRTERNDGGHVERKPSLQQESMRGGVVITNLKE